MKNALLRRIEKLEEQAGINASFGQQQVEALIRSGRDVCLIPDKGLIAFLNYSMGLPLDTPIVDEDLQSIIDNDRKE